MNKLTKRGIKCIFSSCYDRDDPSSGSNNTGCNQN